MATVAHYLERWLEVSAGFVAAHIEHSRHRGVVIARDGLINTEAFPHRPRHSLHYIRDHAPERLKPGVAEVGLGMLARAHRADVIHAHFGYAAADAVAATRGRRPFVLSLHGHDITGRLQAEPGRYDGVVDAVDAVIVPSSYLADVAVAAGFDRATLRVIPSGVDLAFFAPTPVPTDRPGVAFVGRLVEKKGVDILLAAWPQVRAAVPEAHLTVLGDGPLLHVVTAAAAADSSIVWSAPEPARRHEQVRSAIRGATVVATPSRTAADGDSESLLLVNLEAAASHRPVVSTQHGGIPDYVANDQTGLLVREGDADALAEALVRVLTEHSLSQALADGALDAVQQWDVRAMSARVDDLYDDLLARR